MRADACLAAVAATGVPFGIGFNRRFDKSFSVLEAALRRGEIGQIESLSIISRDPAPPPADYITVSGGLFRDMMIHDFDTARWLLGDEPVEVFATGSCLIDPSIGEVGDIDTAVAVLKTASGVICQISNSRRAVYGYDQRIEAFGSKGMLRAENQVRRRWRRRPPRGSAATRRSLFFSNATAMPINRSLRRLSAPSSPVMRSVPVVLTDAPRWRSPKRRRNP